MIEKTLLNYLQEMLPGVPVYLEVPNTPPKEYISILLTGVSEEAPNLCSGLLTIQSYSTSMYNTSLLNDSAMEAINKIIALNQIAHIKLNSSGRQDDATTKNYRYQSVFDMTFYRRSNNG